jgi:hypothetical protein
MFQPRQSSGFAVTLYSQADRTQVTSQSTSPSAKLPNSRADQLQPPPLCIGGDLHRPKLSGHRLPQNERPLAKYAPVAMLVVLLFAVDLLLLLRCGVLQGRKLCLCVDL